MGSEIHTPMYEALKCVNRFLKQFNLKEVELPDTDDNSDTVVAIDHLATELSNIVKQNNAMEFRPQPDVSVTQITASNKELGDRIQAFMAHAQNVIDEQNIKEFCDLSAPRDLSGCARTDASYRRRIADSTHMQVKRASNIDGPQLKATAQGTWRKQASAKQWDGADGLPQPIAERLNNLEMHLNIRSSGCSDVFTRLKNLENRMLAMEGTSPEYFNSNNQAEAIGVTKDAPPSDPANFTLQEIDDKIKTLKQTLSSKKRKLVEKSC